ncbi:hypothetical protein M2A_3026 [Tepidicaulis marinus]|uniref:Uncharacterized protein n=1 Tax=Tepidicaulis marinus TaxID=1333998 RepID=A0A081BEQ9_9HYPH|nr:hypothetical protein M2A_3026 [Tepidicaulis marinus]
MLAMEVRICDMPVYPAKPTAIMAESKTAAISINLAEIFIFLKTPEALTVPAVAAKPACA